MKYRRTKLVFAAILFFSLSIGGGIPTPAFAASTTMRVAPATGSFSQPFTVAVEITSDSKLLNAAQATVATSSNLAVSDLQLGDCQLSFIKTPTVSNPSFTGVILGGSTKHCTVYTLLVTPTASGQGSVSFSNSAVKEYKTGAELLTSIQQGSYSLTVIGKPQVTATPTPAATGIAIQAYDLNITVGTGDNTNIILTPQDRSVSQRQSAVDAEGTARLDKVPPGVYTVAVMNNGKKTNEKIITVSGDQQVMTLGMQEKRKPAVAPVVLVLGIIGSLLILAVVLRFLFIRQGHKE